MAQLQSTRPSHLHYHYLGIDLTDRYATTPRAIDVCGLEVADNGLIAHFWTWDWPAPGALDLSALGAEVRGARRILIDGPQGLAARGNRMRASERELAASGKTPDVIPAPSQLFGGYIRSSVELFLALDKAFGREWLESGRLGEVYPGAIWKRLAPALPKKTTAAGRAARTAVLEALHVRMPVPLPTADQLDACVSALVAAAADGEIDGMNTVAIGTPVFRDEGLREGQMVVPVLSPHKHEHIRGRIAVSDSPTASRSRAWVANRAPAVSRSRPPARAVTRDHTQGTRPGLECQSMADVTVHYDRKGRTLTVWFADRSREHTCSETADEVILIKDASGRVIGFEKLNFSIPQSDALRVAVEPTPA